MARYPDTLVSGTPVVAVDLGSLFSGGVLGADDR
jgi:hypothetical protein